MAIVTNTFLSFSQVGAREDLANEIYNISPTDTPFTNGIGKKKASAKLHEWQTDSLAAAATNAQLEGDEVSFTSQGATTRLGNRCQISRKDMIVSASADAVNTAGREKESLYQLSKRTMELKRDREKILLNNQARVTGNSTTAPQLAGVMSWIKTNVSKASDGTNPTGDGSDARTLGTARAFTEAMLKSVLQLAFDAGGEIDLVMVNSTNKQTVSGFTGGSTRFDKGEDKSLTAAIDVYVSDFGSHKIVANRFSVASSAYCLDMSMWKLAELRKIKTEPLAKTGDADKAFVRTEYTLEACNEASSGIVSDLT